MIRFFGWWLGRALLTLLLAGIACATLVRFAPGYEFDEDAFAAPLSAESRAARRAAFADGTLLEFLARYGQALSRGEFGTSRTLGQPVAELLRSRLPTTVELVGEGLLAGWSAALLLLAPSLWRRVWWADSLGGLLAALSLSVPAGAVAIWLFAANAPAALAIGLVVFPKAYQYTRTIWLLAQSAPHVSLAVAKGVGRPRAILWHILPPAAPALCALFATTVNFAIGAAIPAEVFGDLHGLGQLAYTAASGRDLPVLLSLTLCIAACTVLANLVAELATTPEQSA